MIWWILLALAVIPFVSFKVAGVLFGRLALYLLGVVMVVYALMSFADLSLGKKFIVTGLIGLAYFSFKHLKETKNV